MARDDVEHLIGRLEGDSEVRDRFRQTPDEVAEEHGIRLSDEQRQHLKGIDWSTVSDNELSARVRGLAAASMM
jgi:hypothetical protein